MKVKHDNLIILYITDEWGFNEITWPILAQVIERGKPDYVEFLNPGTFYIYYKGTKQKRKKYDSLLAEMKGLIAGDDRFEDVRVGMANGKMIFEVDWLGRIKSPPIGGPGNDAMKNIIFCRTS